MSGFSLFLQTADQLFQTGIMPLVTEGTIEISGFMPLFAHREVYDIDNLPSGMSLYCHEPDARTDEDGDVWYADNETLHMFTKIPQSGVVDQVSLFTEAKAPLTDNNPTLPLFLKKDGPAVEGHLSLFTTNNGLTSKTSGLGLFTFATNFVNVGSVDSVDVSSPLFIQGRLTPTNIDVSMPLVLQGFDNVETVQASDDLSLFISQGYGFSWDSDNVGKEIDASDNPFASVDSTDAIRGVELICYGGCTDGTCDEVILESHDTKWSQIACVDGGIFRPEKTYSNPNVDAFGSNVPYSGHFYGIRKFDGLKPNAPYFVNVVGKAGSTARIPAPKQLTSWEYEKEGTNTAFSGLKIIGDDPHVSGGRNENDHFGTSVSVHDDLLCVGSPEFDLEVDGSTFTDAGTVFLYRRGPEPVFDEDIVTNKAGWDFETQLVLPSSIRTDYYKETQEPLEGTDRKITKRAWRLGQEGRNFGTSLSATIIESGIETTLDGNDKEVVVVGAPNSKWSRTFPPVSFEENDVLLMVFTDEFRPNIGSLTYLDILKNVQAKNSLYKYFSDPAIDITINMIIFQPIASPLQQDLDFREPKPTFIKKKSMTRHTNDLPGTSEHTTKDAEMLQQIKDAFFEFYPQGGSKTPAILGVYIDDSRSLGSAAVNPAVDNFIEFFKSHTHSEGLIDHAGAAASGAVLETTSQDENWITQTNTLLDFTLDSGTLVNQNHLDLLTDPSTFNVFNTSLPEFNDAPPSGGSVFVFEKESGTWNLVQEIVSPTKDNTTYPDFFGKSVDISDDGDVIVVGSPYLDDAVCIYEYDYKEKDRLYNNIEKWVKHHVDSQTDDNFYPALHTTIDELKTSLRENKDESEFTSEELIELYNQAYRQIYSTLSSDNKYYYRTDESFWNNSIIEEYKKIFTYKYSDITYKGTYKALLEKFAPTSRMGYSVAVNEDGNSFAVGCPTDSLDVTDDSNLYYHPSNNGQRLWSSYVNAGAIRVFESRKYFPHNKVVDFGRFGGAHLKSLGENANLYNHYEDIYKGEDGEDDIPFVRTDFNTREIPQDAGLLFINTPEVDFVNVEMVRRLREWLDLGDRNLVLVANDESWDQSGDYKTSNEIVNKILDSLDSTMKVYGAGTRERSLVDDNACPSRPNIIRADNSFSTYINNDVELYSKGVADIKVEVPDIPSSSNYFINVNQVMYEKYTCDSNYTEYNNVCSQSLENGSDLRAGWDTANGRRDWQALFDDALGVGAKKAPSPLLLAAEYRDPITVNLPAVPARSGVFVEYDTVDDGVAPVFGDPIDNTSAFSWSESSQDYVSLDINFGNNTNLNTFFNPPSKMGVDPVLTCAASNGVDVVTREQEMTPVCHFAAQENIPFQRSSTISLVSSLAAETVDKLYAGSDKNINFYFNLVAKFDTGQAYIAQLNAWSGRSNFTDAKSDSILEVVFTNTGNVVKTNVNLQDLVFTGHPSNNTYNVCWIANPLNDPTEEEVEIFKDWLKKGNKKVIVTYDNDISAASAKKLCELLQVSMSPLYLPQRKKFANNLADRPRASRFYRFSGSRFIKINSSSFISKGFIPNRDSISQLTIDARRESFIPIDINNAQSIGFLNHGIVDDKFVDVGFHFMKTGVCKVDFAVQPDTAYRIFFDTKQYSDLEAETIRAWVSNCSSVPSFTSVDAPPNQNVLNFSDEGTFDSVFNGPIGISASLSASNKSNNTTSIDLQTLPDATGISVFLEGSNPRTSTYSSPPSTLSLVAVSGCEIGVESRSISKRVPRYVHRRISAPVDAQTYTVEFTDPLPISSDSSKYCPDENCSGVFVGTTIDDGPVVAAEEIYYPLGRVQGINSSRITIISDADLVQGSCAFDENGELREDTKTFLRSLYPDTIFPTNINARIFDINNKITSPERGSPAKYVNAVGKPDLVTRFMPPGGTVTSGLLMSDFADTSPNTVNRPDELDSSSLATVSGQFVTNQDYYGSNSKFNWTVSGVTYSDVGIDGGTPSIMQTSGKDFLDFNEFPSGYPGDLFGYSLAYYKDRLVVGAPFAAYSREGITSWEDIADNTNQYETPSGTVVSKWGGAGSAYIYEKNSSDNWYFSRKLRPSGINTGHDLDDVADSELISALGDNDYSLTELQSYSPVTDKFGYSVDIDGDVIAVGTPGHDYTSAINSVVEGAFQVRHFNFEFDVSKRISQDLGDPATRALLTIASGILNNGAIYTFEYRYPENVDSARSWEFIEKLAPKGYNSRLQKTFADESNTVVSSGTENEHFGENVSIYRARRSDADYTVGVGSPYHKFATSGNHTSPEPLEGAGAVFLFDAMLRTPFAYSAGQANIEASTYGSIERKVNINFDNTDLDKLYYSNGIIYANNQGEIFIEASGQDSNADGFSIHRPYIQSILGRKPDSMGSASSGTLSMNVSSIEDVLNVEMPLYCSASNQANVYNNVALFVGAMGRPDDDNTLILYADCPAGVESSGEMPLFVSGIGVQSDNIHMITFGF